MVLWIEGIAVDMPCNQRAELLETNGRLINIRLLGTGKEYTIEVKFICGLELSANFTIDFDFSGSTVKSYS